MKKIFYALTIFIALQVIDLHAQSFSIPSATYTVWFDSTQNMVSVPVPITNAGNQNLDVIVEKTVMVMAPHHSSLFCFGIACYDTASNSSAVLSFPSHTTETLLADLNTNYSQGWSCVTYRIKDVNNPSDYADVEICYNITNTGINTPQASSTISSPGPNPADKFTTFNYELNGMPKDHTISIFNMLGNKVQVTPLHAKKGMIIIPTAELTSGVYFYTLTEGDKIISTNKLIVSHKN